MHFGFDQFDGASPRDCRLPSFLAAFVYTVPRGTALEIMDNLNIEAID
jgi:hypothetical protein